MGEPRFIYGFLKGLISNKSCNVRVELLNVQLDKDQLLSSWKAGECKVHDGKAEVWTEFEKPWLYFAYVYSPGFVTFALILPVPENYLTWQGQGE